MSSKKDTRKDWEYEEEMKKFKKDQKLKRKQRKSKKSQWQENDE